MDKKAKVALILCPCWSNLCPPLGITYLASMLRSRGYEAKCFDINIEIYNLLKQEKVDFWDFGAHYQWSEPFYSERILPLIRNYLKNKAEEIIAFNPDIIGFTIFYTNKSASLYLAEEIKKHNSNKTIIFGGPECYNEAKDFSFLNSGTVDAVVIGEGEQTFEELVNTYTKNKAITNIKGALIKNNGIMINGGFRVEVEDLDSLALPDFKDFNLNYYKRFALPMLTSRGCVGRCTFCSEIRYWRNFRFRSAQNVFEELKQGINCYNVREFFFNDSLINGNLPELFKLIDLIIENNLDIVWGGYARVHKGMGLDMLKRLKKAGCSYLSYGIESGSQRVLRDMSKQISLKDAELNLSNTVKVGMQAHVNWIVGFPTESWVDFLKSLIFIYKNRKHISHFNPGQLPCGIPPDSDLAKNPDKFKIAKKPFLNSWRCRYFRNTIIHRRLRLKILGFWVTLLGISHS